MTRIKRIIIFLAVGLLFVFLSSNIIGQDISSRAIILGIGIDYDSETKEYIATTEIISPGGGSDQQVGTFSKIVEGRGDTIASALNDIYAQTGRKTSLGQCQILLLGESMYKQVDLNQCLPYFILSEAFKDSSSLCCTVGEANALMKTRLPFSDSISLTLVELLKDAGKLVAVPSTFLSKFMQSQLSITHAGVLNIIEYVENTDQASEQSDNSHPQGTYRCGNVAVFKNNQYVVSLDSEQSLAYTILATDCVGQLFAVQDDREEDFYPDKVCTVLTQKNVDYKVTQDNSQLSVVVEVDTKVHNLLNGYQGKETPTHPRWTATLSPDMIEQTKTQIVDLLDKFFAVQKQYNFDVVNIYKVYELKYGKEWKELSNQVSFDEFQLSYQVSVGEN